MHHETITLDLIEKLRRLHDVQQQLDAEIDKAKKAASDAEMRIVAKASFQRLVQTVDELRAECEADARAWSESTGRKRLDAGVAKVAITPTEVVDYAEGGDITTLYAGLRAYAMNRGLEPGTEEYATLIGQYLTTSYAPNKRALRDLPESVLRQCGMQRRENISVSIK